MRKKIIKRYWPGGLLTIETKPSAYNEEISTINMGSGIDYIWGQDQTPIQIQPPPEARTYLNGKATSSNMNPSSFKITKTPDKKTQTEIEQATNGQLTSNNKDAEIKPLNLFNNSGFSGINSMIRGGFDSIATAVGSQKEDTQDKFYDAASGFVSQFGVVGKIAAGAIDFWNFTDKVGGRKIKSVDGTTGSSSYANNNREAKHFRMTQGSAASKYQKLVDSSLKQTAMARNIVNLNRQAVQAKTQAVDNMNRSFLNKKAGGVSGSLLTAKNGGVLKEIKSTISKYNRKLILEGNFFEEKPQESSDIKMFKDGGAVIPSGALHKNKHHLESIDPNLKQNITTKGIPVITIEEGGEIKQHAEIEKEEVILSLSLTKQIEQLWKEGTDEAAIEAGKLLTEALLRDTEDNVGLIEKIENESKG